ncbi:bifunctional aminoglycoside phosphotransferase/ATP-binding protein [Xanthobacter sediminis]|uniref:bifunctional aminoglycoside phosphotransferase/ATP-binding protein n=1 Tax=Xanthobacter sediminis TaxID=3119926 RepID=UPI00372B14B0
MDDILHAGRDDHVVADQGAVFRFLADPASHGLPPGETVRRIDTHGAAVFLAGPYAYKVKRAVYFPFMDFSTLEKRRAACAAELAISGANAPGLYLGVVPITRQEGGLALGGTGAVVDYAVKMRRFDPADTLDQVAARAPFDRTLVAALAQAVIRAHERAEVRSSADVTTSLASYLADNRATFARHPGLFDAGEAAALSAQAEAELARLAPLLRARAEEGFVRRCHGDLHLGNIVLLDGAPVLFDAIEFSDDIAVCDVLYDLAFLLMDLWQRGLWGAAGGVFNRYLWAQLRDDALDGLAALPFFLSLRAAIRAKVETAGLAHLPAEVQSQAERRIRHLFASARDLLAERAGQPQSPPPEDMPAALRAGGRRLVAIGGLSGTGKTTRALRWAPFIGRAPGAVVLRSDIERKRLFGAREGDSLPEAAYSPEVTQQVYTRMRALAGRVLATGQSVVLDAVHARPWERADAEALAGSLGVPFHGIWLDAPLDVRVERVDRRKSAGKDASDADGEVARRQQAYDVGPMTWTRLASG